MSMSYAKVGWEDVRLRTSAKKQSMSSCPVAAMSMCGFYSSRLGLLLISVITHRDGGNAFVGKNW